MNIKIKNGFDSRPQDWTPDISVIIDVFRASTTSLAVLAKEPKQYLMANDLSMIQDLLKNSYRLISEVFDLGIDNSPTLVRQQVSSGEKIVHKTTNLTTALEKNHLETPMIIGCFNNMDSVVEHIVKGGFLNIEIIPAGKMKTQKEAPEDTLCSKMLANKLQNGFCGYLEGVGSLLISVEEKKSQENWPQHFIDDLELAVQLNLSDIVPMVTKVKPGLFEVMPA